MMSKQNKIRRAEFVNKALEKPVMVPDLLKAILCKLVDLDESVSLFHKELDAMADAKLNERNNLKNMSVAQVARFFQVSPNTVYSWKSKGVLNAFQVQGKLLFERAEVENLVRKKIGRPRNKNAQFQDETESED